MEFSLSFPVAKLPIELVHGTPIVLLGSCFSDELEVYFKKAGFGVLSNPFGTLFHPLALSSVIQSSLNGNEEIDIFQRSDLYFSWDASSKVFGMTEDELKSRIVKERFQMREQILSAQVLIITFGSAFGYYHKELNKTVANCHKAPKAFFDKQLSSVEDMCYEWLETIELIKRVNPTIQLVFTVSPVRHSKDGLMENNRSKARLIELVHRICEETSAHYFPSYEIVMDELRDYRFFEKDFVHPNKLAVDYVWEKFSEAAFSEETRMIIKKVNAYNSSAHHIPIHPDSEEAKKHTEHVQKLREELQEHYSKVILL